MNSKRYQTVLDAMKEISVGSVKVTFPDGKVENYGILKRGEIVANITLNNYNLFDELIANGDIGLGESYMKGDWETSNLPDLLQLFILNAESLEKFFHANRYKLFWLAMVGYFKRNTKRGSKSNISYHYDLGNEFYSLWLDRTMTYSSAIFGDEKDRNLERAQLVKYNRILENIDQGSILEIGCGWGGFAIEAARRNNKVKCLTISKEQTKFATDRVSELGFDDLIDIKIQDYRDEKGVYDAVASIEMFEAVGKEYWPDYFKTVNKSLKKGGRAMIQAITICDDVYSGYKKRTDFIQKYIFPGGYLPSKSAFEDAAGQQGLKVVEKFCFGQDYAKTLLEWLKSFDRQKKKVLKMGFDEKFIKMWRFYLSYCAAAFAAERTDVVQFLLVKK